eukprot:1363786-Karenia_brevis.AAC.1
MRGRYTLDEALATLAMSVNPRKLLRRTCEAGEFRFQVERANGRNMYYLQSVGVSSHEGGKIWSVPSDA